MPEQKHILRSRSFQGLLLALVPVAFHALDLAGFPVPRALLDQIAQVVLGLLGVAIGAQGVARREDIRL